MASTSRNVSLSPPPSGRGAHRHENADEGEEDDGSLLNVKDIASRFNHNKRKTSFKPTWAKSTSVTKSSHAQAPPQQPLHSRINSKSLEEQNMLHQQQHKKNTVEVTPNHGLKKTALAIHRQVGDISSQHEKQMTEKKVLSNSENMTDTRLQMEEITPSNPRGRQLIYPIRVTVTPPSHDDEDVNQPYNSSRMTFSTSRIENKNERITEKTETEENRQAHSLIQGTNKQNGNSNFQSKLAKFSKHVPENEDSTNNSNTIVPPKKALQIITSSSAATTVSTATTTVASTATLISSPPPLPSTASQFWKNQIKKSNGDLILRKETNEATGENNIDSGTVVTKDSPKESKSSEKEVLLKESQQSENIWKNQRIRKSSSSIKNDDPKQQTVTLPLESISGSNVKNDDSEIKSVETTHSKKVVSGQVEFITTSDSVGHNIKLWKQREQQNETTTKPLAPSRWKRQTFERSSSVPPSKDRSPVEKIKPLNVELQSGLKIANMSSGSNKSKSSREVAVEEDIEPSKEMLVSLSNSEDDKSRYKDFLNRDIRDESFESNGESSETEKMRLSLGFHRVTKQANLIDDTNKPDDEENNYECETPSLSEPCSPDRKTKSGDTEGGGTPLRSNRSIDVADDDNDTISDGSPQYAPIPVSQRRQQLWGPGEKLKTWQNKVGTKLGMIDTSRSKDEVEIVKSQPFEVVRVSKEFDFETLQKRDPTTVSSVKQQSDDLQKVENILVLKESDKMPCYEKTGSISDDPVLSVDNHEDVRATNKDPTSLPAEIVKQQDWKSLEMKIAEKERIAAKGNIIRMSRSQDDDIVFKSRFYEAARIAHQRECSKVEKMDDKKDVSSEVGEPMNLPMTDHDITSKSSDIMPSLSQQTQYVGSSSSDPGAVDQLKTHSVELLLDKLTAVITTKDNPDAALKEIDQILQLERRGLGVLSHNIKHQATQHTLQPTIVEDETLGGSHLDEFANIDDGFSDEDDDDDEDDYSDDDSTVSSITNPTYHESHIKSYRQSRAHQYSNLYQTGPQKGLPIPPAKPELIPHSKLENQFNISGSQFRVSELRLERENSGRKHLEINGSQIYRTESSNAISVENNTKAVVPVNDNGMISTVKPFYEKGKSINNKGLLKQIKHWEEDDDDASQGQDKNPPSPSSERLQRLADAATKYDDEELTSSQRRRSLSANPDRSRVFYPHRDTLSKDFVRNDPVNLDASDWESIPGVDFFSSTRIQRRADAFSSSKRFIDSTLHHFG